MVTKFGKSIRFHETDVRVTGRVSMGVIGMNLDDGDEIIGMQMDSQGETLLVVSENGIGKRTDISEFPIQKRGGKGVLCYKIVEKTGYLVGAKLVHEDHDIMMITNEGIVCLLYTSTANDMELGIETKVEGSILSKGKIALDAKLLSEIIRKLSGGESDITIESDDKYNLSLIHI